MRAINLLLLLFFLFLYRKPCLANRANEILFSFTAPEYNITLEENARGNQFASCEDIIKMGVPLPHPNSIVKFKIVEGDKNHQFKAHSKQVGDFVFLRIRQKEKNDTPLNRELKDSYKLVVKATSKQKDSGNVETTAIVQLRVLDRNDASPMFTLLGDQYESTITEDIPPFTDVLKVEASDADIGINGEIYYSLVNRSSDFTVDPVSGWIRSLRPLQAGKYNFQVRAEDRASRIFHYDEEQKQPSWASDVQITVTEKKRANPKLLVEKRTVYSHKTDIEQIAGFIRIEGGTNHSDVTLVDDDLRHWFHLNRSGDTWTLYTNRGRSIKEGTNVTLSVGIPHSHEANTTATVIIDVARSYNISFPQSKYVFDIDEDIPLGYKLGRITVDTISIEDQKLVRFNISGDTNSSALPFAIDSELGTIRVTSLLDFETQKAYRFQITTKLLGHAEVGSSLISVEINIHDSNDHFPVFAAKWGRQGPIAVTDKTAIGSVITKIDAIDHDSNENGKIAYKLLSESPIPFDVNHFTGEISLSRSLPIGENTWKATLWAIDGGHPLPRSASLNLVFYRNGTKVPSKPRPVFGSQPSNSHTPSFIVIPKTVMIAENAEIGTVITTVNATDEDVGYNGMVQFSTVDDYFDVDRLTGQITVSRSLKTLLTPGSENAKHDLTILVSDLGTPRKSTTGSIRVVIQDVNNYVPQFDQPWYRTRVLESNPVGTKILIVTATDQDHGEAGRVGYRLIAQGESYVQIDERTGELTISQPLDREFQEVLRYTVVAFDYGNPQLSSFVNLTIEVLDVNDNPPVCLERITTMTIPEDFPDTALVGCISAFDRDVGINARLRYSIESDESRLPFYLDPILGCLFVKSPSRPLDYQVQSVYNISVEISDNGESILSTTCYFVVQLSPVIKNNLGPLFEDVAHEASVYENMPIGTEVFTLRPLIQAKSSNDYLFSLIDGNGLGYFSINDGTIRTLVIFDREEQSSYWLTIEVSHALSNFRYAVMHVFVRILDKNDHRPFPSSPMYVASVKENSPQNTVVIKLEATDADELGESQNTLYYSIIKGDPQSFFRIDPNTGYITTSGSRKLDRETQSEHELSVSICDSGDPQMCTIVPVIISIEDVNDNSPVFAQPIHHYNVKAGESGTLCRVFASDSDSGANGELYYNITDGDSRFSIDEHGTITTSEPLGNDEVFPLTVQATDRGLPAHLTQTRVVITGVARTVSKKKKNKKPVIKNSPPNVTISESDQVGVSIIVLEANDDEAEVLWWSIEEGNIDHVFSMRTDTETNTGTLLLAKPVSTLPSGTREITLVLSVSDGELSTSTKITLKVVRNAPERPKFSAANYHTEISEKTAIGSTVYNLKVVNHKSEGKVTYSLYSAEDDSMMSKFRIEPNSGNVVVVETLDYEITRSIRLIVVAQRGSLSGYAFLTITLVDENDNPPRFLQKEFFARIPPNAPTGYVVIKMLAHDHDFTNMKALRYSTISGNEEHLFSLGEISGVVRVAKPLSGDFNEAVLTIRASDGERRSLTDHALLRIQIDSNGEKNIKFRKPVYQVSVKDDTVIGTPLFVVATTGCCGKYSMKDPCPYLSVHSITGTVSTRKWFTSERSKSLECTIVYEHPSGNSTAKISIRLINTNKYYPIFNTMVYHGFIRENSAAGSSVLLEDGSPMIISANDKDYGPNGLVTYRILDKEPLFTVDFATGAVKSRVRIDFEKTKEAVFYVYASDMGHPMHTSALPSKVVVEILDENDEKPTFQQKNYEVELRTPTTVGVKIADILAVDKDTIGKLRYFIKNSTMIHWFEIDKNSGLLKTGSNINDLKEKELKLEVVVTDGLFSDTCLVKVKVVDVSSKESFRCYSNNLSLSLPENTRFDVGREVLSVSVDNIPEGVPLTYNILNHNEHFLINGKTGLIMLAGPSLDREAANVLHLLVQVHAHARPPVVTQCVIDIEVLDENDNAPMFLSKPYEITTSINANVNDHLLTIKAVDSDSGENGIVHYFSSDMPKLFNLDSVDGKITVAAALTEVGVYEFKATASDKGVPPLSTTVKVKVNVLDKNIPFFVEKQYTAMVSQKTAIKATIIIVKAMSTAEGHIAYSIDKGNEEKIFSIDITSGEIVLAKHLNMALKNNYTLSVSASDVLRNKVKATVPVIIQIESFVEEVPQFDKPVYFVNVTESTAPGSELIQVSTLSINSTISYSLSGPQSSVARIESSTGTVFLVEPLDYEKRKDLILNLLATTPSDRTAESKLIIHVLDVNDVAPIFVPPSSSVEISDAFSPGQLITIMKVVDEDTVSSLTSGSRLFYSVIDGDESLFSIGESNGEVILNRAVDNEDLLHPKKRLNISVSDGVFTVYTKLEVSIIVSGLRTPPPRFEQSQYVLKLLENRTPKDSSVLLNINGVGGALPLRYLIGSSDASVWPLSIDKITGEITQKSAVLFSNQSTYNIPLIVEDAIKRRGFATLSLLVLDENDNPPKFIVPKYVCTISSSLKEGDSVLLVSATDSDSGDVLEYSILADDDIAPHFNIHTRQGLITLGRRLTDIGATMSFTVKATDSANPPHHSTTEVVLNVVGDDVAVPKFSSNHYIFNVNENVELGTVVGKLQHSEPSVKGARYSIADASKDLPFLIEKQSGKIVVRGALDRESQSEWKFVAALSAPSNAVSLSTVTIMINDLDDNAPVFQTVDTKFEALENTAVGTTLTVFSAVDKDEVASGRVYYSIVNASSKDVVKVDRDSGWLFVASKLDREQSATITFVVRASDDAGNFADLNCRLEVIDVNDEPPVFVKQQYRALVDMAKVNPGQSIARVHYKDKDGAPYNKSQFFITAGNDDGLFKIDGDGRVSMVHMYYPSKKTAYDLTIMAFDGLHSATTSVKVDFKPMKVPQCNDEALYLNITENSPIGSVIWQDGSSLSYEIKAIDKSIVPFSLRTWNSTSTIISSVDIDREKKSLYSFKLRSFMKFPVMECMRDVHVSVLDMNDNDPIFTQEVYTASIKENLPASPEKKQFVLSVEAIDQDSGSNGFVQYSLVEAPDMFEIDLLSGVITVNKLLDSEQRASYEFTVVASDSGDPPRSGKASIKINVIDQNDNPPTFEMVEYNVKVLESESIDALVASVVANGGDQNESVTYSLEDSPNNDYVHLDTTTGKIILAKYLDFEVIPGFKLVVVATDSGNPPLSSKAIVNVEVLDENDNYPTFVSKEYKAEVKENSKKGTKVIKIQATDADSEHYGKIKYSIVGEKGPFEINDGTVVVAGDIDYEKNKEFILNIDAKDGGGLTSSVPLVITVVDLNDNAPQFASCNMTAVVQEGVSVGYTVYTLAIKDQDGPNFGEPFSVKLHGVGNNTFKIVDNEVVTALTLNHSEKNKYDLTVIAIDKGGLSTECPLYIFVKEESRHAPKLVPLKIRLNTLKGEFKGGIIGTLRGFDEDQADMLRYSLIDGSVIGPMSGAGNSVSSYHEFSVNAESGDIWAANDIVPGLHAFNVSVTDGKFNTLSYVEIEVSVLDSDILDNAVAIRILDVSIEDFFKSGLNDFIKVFSNCLNVPPENINILSIQQRGGEKMKRSTNKGVDILFTVQRGYGGVDRGLLKPTHIYSRLKNEFDDLENASKLQLELITEVCMPGVCERGECREKIELSEEGSSVISYEGISYASPGHSRFAQCSCPDGYGGKRCSIEVNKCSSSPCRPDQMCVADTTSGYECICPPGTQGDRCEQPDCEEGQCSEDAELSVDGSGYFELSLPTDVEERMELNIEIRTISYNGTVVYGHGSYDYHELLLLNGFLEYHWDCGSGLGIIKSSTQIVDGKWHRIRITRNGRHARLVVDGTERQEGWSATGTDVINLQSFATQLLFGAKVNTTLFGTSDISNGVAACFRTVTLDGRSLSKGRNSIRLFGVHRGCSALSSTPCSESPCKNGATCLAQGKTASCLCPPRYEGEFCEIDKLPCEDEPCPLSIQCIPFHNDYLCKCPNGYTGKRCDGPRLTEPREDACLSKPCGSGECFSIPRQSISTPGYICKCPMGYSPGPCEDEESRLFIHVTAGELIVVSIIFILIVCCVLAIFCVCRWLNRKSSDPKYGEHVSYNNHMRNPNVSVSGVEPSSAPPPLPPRVFRGNKLSNLEQAQLTGLPTVQVRPFPIQERLASGESRSPSIVGSKKWGNSSETEDLLGSDHRASQDAQALEALRRFGIKLQDDGGSVRSTSVRHQDRRPLNNNKSVNHDPLSLNQDRYPIGDSIQCIPSSFESSHWDDGVDRIGAAVRQERLRLQGLNGRMHIGDTVLSPLINDDDYMTMRPRKVTDSTESHKRPLLADQDAIYDQADSGPPSPPAHKHALKEDIRMYDDPLCASTSDAPGTSANLLASESLNINDHHM